MNGYPGPAHMLAFLLSFELVTQFDELFLIFRTGWKAF
jgi:undecaprenyl-diphosphatase